MAEQTKKILIIEDDLLLINLLKIHIQDLGCTTEVSMNGNEGYNKALEGHFDLIILDVMLPGMDGISVCQRLRAHENQTPILMLTAKSEEFDKVLGLESGADDYLTKPFGVRELVARIKAILRRKEIDKLASTKNSENGVMRFDGLEIDVEKRKVLLNNQRINLSPKEFELLLVLAKNPGKSYNRDQLLNKIWGYDYNGYEHTLNSHINRLRSKIEANVSQPKYILTSWGHGYRFNDEI
ncbi:MAG: response regulator transcription factor [Bacteroidota bacterium]|nr:response regulator transcription factor [Bacteroidota bacterium]